MDRRAQFRKQDVQLLRVPTSLLQQYSERDLEDEGRTRYGEPSLVCDEPQVFLGSCFNARHAPTVDRISCKTVIVVAAEEQSAPESASLRVLRCNLPDECAAADMAAVHDAWASLFPVLEQGDVLIHCKHGQSRSAAVVVAFLMHRNGWSLDVALAEVRRRRPIVDPNDSVLQQLVAYEQRLHDSKNKKT